MLKELKINLKFVNFSGAVKFDDLLNSPESDRSSIENLQPSISPDAGCNIQV